MKKYKNYILSALIFFFYSFFIPYLSYGEEDLILLSSGESKTVTVDSVIKKVAIGNPSIADVRVLSSYELLINGKDEGSTSLIIWTKEKKISRKIVVSRIDTGKVIKEIKALLKGVKGINVSIKAGKIVLDGKILNQKDIPVVENIVNKYKGKIINFVELPVQMIKINVRVVEIATSDENSIGIDWQKRFQFVENTIEGLYKIGKIVRSTKVDALLDFLAKSGKAKIVARPNIIVINGERANFHSGGRLLVPLISQNNVSIDEKPYGIDLQILPYGDRRSNLIKTEVKIEVSNLDWKNAVKYQDGTVPAIRDRKIETQIDVKLGTTIVIAGLLMDEEQTFKKKIPIIGSIPLLGLLFSTKETRKIKTELVVFLTPSFVNFIGEEIVD